MSQTVVPDASRGEDFAFRVAEVASTQGGALTVRVVGVKREDIVRETVRLLEDPDSYAAMASAVNPYGDGKASQRIVQALLSTHCAVARG